MKQVPGTTFSKKVDKKPFKFKLSQTLILIKQTRKKKMIIHLNSFNSRTEIMITILKMLMRTLTKLDSMLLMQILNKNKRIKHQLLKNKLIKNRRMLSNLKLSCNSKHKHQLLLKLKMLMMLTLRMFQNHQSHQRSIISQPGSSKQISIMNRILMMFQMIHLLIKL